MDGEVFKNELHEEMKFIEKTVTKISDQSDLRGENAFLEKEITSLKAKNKYLDTRMMGIE